jgi:hypothetical protein
MVFFSLSDLAKHCEKTYRSKRGTAFDLEFLCNMSMEGKARACRASGGSRVYVAMIKEADFDESTSSLASLELFRELCDLLNAQPDNF